MLLSVILKNNQTDSVGLSHASFLRLNTNSAAITMFDFTLDLDDYSVKNVT